jgi:hypothetical protein
MLGQFWVMEYQSSNMGKNGQMLPGDSPVPNTGNFPVRVTVVPVIKLPR